MQYDEFFFTKHKNYVFTFWMLFYACSMMDNILIYVAYNKNILDKLLDNYFYKIIISKKCLDFLLGFDATSKVLLI